MFKSNPLTGNKYNRRFFTAERVVTLLFLTDISEKISFDTLTRIVTDWTREQQNEAGDWALRTHLNASDNLNRVPRCPDVVQALRTIYPYVTGRLSCSKPNLQNIPIKTELGKEIKKKFTGDPQ